MNRISHGETLGIAAFEVATQSSTISFCLRLCFGGKRLLRLTTVPE